MMQIGLGTAAIGRPHYINIRQTPGDKSYSLPEFKKHGIELLETAYQAGVRYFDTAPGYGTAEQIMHEWLKNRSYELELATKWGYRYTANFDLMARIHEVKDHSVDHLNEQWAHSKNILPQAHTLQIHSATFETGVLKDKAVLARLAEIKEADNVLIGMTSTGDNQVEVLKYALDVHFEGTALIDVFQVTYNVLDQSLAVMREAFAGKRLVIKEALANGRLFRNNNYKQYHALYSTMERLANKYGVGVDAVAIRFCLNSIDPFVVLSGVSTKQQLKDNLLANTIQMTKEELDELKGFSVSPESYWAERKQLAWN